MFEHSASVTMVRAPAEVFAFLADFERTPTWVPEFREMTRIDGGPLQCGSGFNHVRKLPV